MIIYLKYIKMYVCSIVIKVLTISYKISFVKKIDEVQIQIKSVLYKPIYKFSK